MFLNFKQAADKIFVAKTVIVLGIEINE